MLTETSELFTITSTFYYSYDRVPSAAVVIALLLNLL